VLRDLLDSILNQIYFYLNVKLIEVLRTIILKTYLQLWVILIMQVGHQSYLASISTVLFIKPFSIKHNSIVAKCVKRFVGYNN